MSPEVTSPSSTVDPILLDIVEGAVEATIVEIESYVDRTARSTVVREQHDFRAAVFDKETRLLSRVSFVAEIQVLKDKFAGRIHEGDVFIYNSVYTNMFEAPYGRYTGIQHLGDVCVVEPVFYRRELVAFVQCFGHVQDVGGTVVGSLPWHTPDDGQTIFHEGIQIPIIKLYERGELNWSVLELILTNSRFPKELKGDIDAFVFALKKAARRIIELCERYGPEAVQTCFFALIDRCARAIRQDILPQIPNGTYTFEDFADGDGIIDIPGQDKWSGDEPLKIRCRLSKRGEKLTVDFTGTSPQCLGSLNLAGDERFYKKYFGSLLRLYAPEVVINEGVCDVVEVILPRGTFLSPNFPASVGNRWVPMVTLITAYMGCLMQATEGNTPAAFNFAIVAGYWWENEEGYLSFMREIWGNGSGARPYADGTDTVDMVPESKNIPIEFMESAYPILLTKRALGVDSGGPGKYRGGLGYFEEWVFLAGGHFQIGSGCERIPPWGAMGGKPGRGVKFVLNPGTDLEEHPYHYVDNVKVKKGDVLHIYGAGGGGWGDPLERDPLMVQRDVIQGKVSPESARADYGVVLRNPAWEIDDRGTMTLREKLRKERPPLKMFDRGEKTLELFRRFNIRLEPGTY